MRVQGALYQSQRRAISVRVKEHHQALQEVRIRQKGAEFREKYRSRSGIEGTISKAGSRLWSSSQSLSWHAENPFAAFDDCDSYQLGPCLGVGGPNAFGEDAHFALWGFSFGSLSPQVRQQYQIEGEPLFWLILEKSEAACYLSIM